jgi:hypothetical protein
MHYVNKVKAYLNFHINHLKLLKKNRIQIILANEQCNEYYNYEQY